MSIFICLCILGATVRYSNGDSAYLDGFYNKYLPGSPDDPLQRPNTPFVTDTSRYGDGITSSSYFDVTSPSFPDYEGFSGNTTERYIYYREYAISAAEQGIAVYGLGDARNEDARFKIISQENYQSFPNPTKTFPVHAAIKWNPSNFAIREGEYYSIFVNGTEGYNSTQYWYDGGIKVDANGYSSYFDPISNCYVGMGRCRSHLKKKRRIVKSNWMSLGCAIGQYVRPLYEVESGSESLYRYLPLDESELIPTVFNVGYYNSFRAGYNGQLICFTNDAYSLYWNNHGTINVTVTRISWPPSNETYYQVQYLPSCDSAQVFYVNRGINDESPGKIKCNENGGGSGWKLDSNSN